MVCVEFVYCSEFAIFSITSTIFLIEKAQTISLIVVLVSSFILLLLFCAHILSFTPLPFTVCHRYHDGMIATRTGMPEIMMKRLFYPKWWLQVRARSLLCVDNNARAEIIILVLPILFPKSSFVVAPYQCEYISLPYYLNNVLRYCSTSLYIHLIVQATGYFENLKGQFGPGVILFAPNPTSSTGTKTGSHTVADAAEAQVCCCVYCVL